MTSRDRSRRNRRTPSVAFTVPGEGPLARLVAQRLSAVDAGDTWVHVAYEPGAALGQAEVPSFDTFLVAAAAAGAGHIVVVTSAMVLGPVTDATLPIPEDAPVAPPCGDPEVDRLRSLEHQVQELRRHPDGPRLHVLRPAVVVGPGLDSPFVRHFASPLLLTARGSQPAWQFCHVDDLASACRWVVAEDLDEAAVGAPGHLDALDLARLARRRRLELPEAALLGAAERLHQFGVSPTSSGLMRYLVHPWPVEVSRLPAVGWTATVDNATGLQLLIDVARDRVGVAGRLVPRREAVGGAAGAAGVTVAALGAAALVRRARRRNGGGAG